MQNTGVRGGLRLGEGGRPLLDARLRPPPPHAPFSADGAPLSELSWSSSLAVVAVSFSGLFTVIVLMLACLCCKKGGIGFKVRAGVHHGGPLGP